LGRGVEAYEVPKIRRGRWLGGRSSGTGVGGGAAVISRVHGQYLDVRRGHQRDYENDDGDDTHVMSSYNRVADSVGHLSFVLFIGNSFTYGHGSPVRSYRSDTVTDLNNTGIFGVPALF